MGQFNGKLAIIFSLVSLFSFQKANGETIPWSCLVNGSNSIIDALPCKNYKKVGGGGRTFSNVCIFQNGLWKRGTVKVNIDESVSVVNGTAVMCTRGITALNLDTTGRIAGSSVAWVIQGLAGVTYNSTGKFYTSSVTYASQNILSTEKPLGCAVSGDLTEPTKFQQCSMLPNRAGYCKWVGINTAKFKGNWWVRYGGEDQTNMTVCSYGVRIVNFQELADATAQKYKIASTPIYTKADFLTTFASVITQYPKLAVSACYSLDANNSKIRNSCKNSEIFSRTTAPTDFDVEQCYIYPENGVLVAMYMLEDGTNAATASKRSCDSLEKLNVKEIIPSGIDDTPGT